MAVCCENLTLGVLSSRSTLYVLVGTLFKKFGLFLNTPRIMNFIKILKQETVSQTWLDFWLKVIIQWTVLKMPWTAY